MAPDEPDRPSSPSPPAGDAVDATTPPEAGAPADAPGPADAGAAPAVELRGSDFLHARTSDELEKQALDPATVAQLAAWFGLPSYTELEEKAAAAAAPPPSENEDDQRWREIHEKLAAHVEPALIERVASTVHRGDRLLTLREPPPLPAEGKLIRFDETQVDEVVHGLDPIRELELSWEFLSDLKDCAPQAILRDLYRPEADFCEPATWREPHMQPEPDRSGEIREIMSLRFPMPPWIKPLAEHLEATADLRQWKRKNWGELGKSEAAPVDAAREGSG